MKAHDRYLALAAMGSGVFALGMLIGFGYLSSIFVSSRGASGIVFESPLLPSGWQTYRGDGWSVGYSEEYLPQERPSDNTVYFIPEDFEEKKTYFLVQWKTQTLSEEKIAREAAGYKKPDEIMIANYPALKYTLNSGRVEFLVAYGALMYSLIADDPEDSQVAPMFATFAFTE
jgi:hypothetical protein